MTVLKAVIVVVVDVSDRLSRHWRDGEQGGFE
jgi:hypothetical protein